MATKFKTLNQWKPWIYVNNVINNIQYPDVSFPFSYVPSNGFWNRSIIDNCLISWLNVPSTFESFLLGGGGVPHTAGSISGLTVANELLNISNKSQTFAVGRGANPPIMGYCIGNKFKQQVYTRLDVQNDGQGGTIVTNVSVDLLQNSRFKRVYVNNGSVVKYTNNTSEHLLNIGIIKSPPPSDLNISGLVTIIKSGNSNVASETITANVLGLKNNWDLIISSPSKEILSGDYYKLDTTLCIEDPYLLSGFWRGSESSYNIVPSSGLDLYRTSHNSPYEEGKFLGLYIWKSDSLSANATSNVVSSVLSQPSTFATMNDSNNSTWAFLGFGNSQEYKIYPNDKRYREIHLSTPDSSGAIVNYKERLAATSEDYNLLKSQEPTHIRVEIGTGGYTNRHNWYAPCLKGQFIKTGGKTYKITNHLTFNIIDISYLDIEGTTSFDPLSNQSYSIVNEYGWMLNEHYEGRITTKNNTGVFKGIINSINNKKISVTTYGDTYISLYKQYGLSFIDRFQKSVSLSGSLKKCFSKFEGWKIVSSSKEYLIKDINFGSSNSTVETPYSITIDLLDIPTNLKVGDLVYISFDSTFNVYGNISKESGFSFSLNVKPALLNQPQGFLISDSLCMNGEFLSIPYKIVVDNSDQIGYTEGYLFGITANGSAQSTYSQMMYLTVPGAFIGTSSLFHKLRKEDWVAFQDPVTTKITIRKGSLDFIEFPKKEMVTFGPSSFTNTSGSIVSLDSQYDMLRKLKIKFLDNTTNNIALFFGTGNPNNTYGFYVSGAGMVNLMAYQRQGFGAGTVPNDRYNGYGYKVSPCYLYKPAAYYNINPSSFNLGTATNQGPIYLNDTNIGDVMLEYVKENQTLSNAGYYDIVFLKDGGILLIYGYSIGSFNLSNSINYLNNSNDNNTTWTDSNAVMVLGTNDDIWRAPLSEGNGNDQYPLMILNSVTYLSTIYNELSNILSIFVKCTVDNKTFLGCYNLSVYNLQHCNYVCNPVSSSLSQFLWKPPLLLDSFINDINKSWINPNSIVKDNYSFNPSDSSERYASSEYFIRIMGFNGSNSQIENNEDFGIITTRFMGDGLYLLFYDSNDGVKMLFSNDCGLLWHKTNIIFYKNAKNAILIRDYLFAITPEGIEVKRTDPSDFKSVITISLLDAGTNRTNQEITLQTAIDNRRRMLIGSGPVEYQRLSGYMASDGTIKIFFYDVNGLLKCMESKGSPESVCLDSWIVSNNF